MPASRSRCWRGLLLALALVAGHALADATIVRVLGPTGAVAPHATAGFNYGLAMQVALYAQEFGAIDIRALRYPPGNDADNYPLTPDMIDALRVPWGLLGEPELHVVANFFEGPDHAVAAARHFHEVGVPVRWWEVGNEPDLYPQNRMDPSWTPEVYCERFRRFADALRREHPDGVIAGPAVSGSRPLGEDFLRAFLRLCGDAVDVLTWHVYPTDGTWEDDAALATADQVGEEIRRFRRWTKDPAMNPLGHERDIGLAITEFGLSWRTASFRHLEDMTAAVWLADALGQMATEGLDLSHYFALQGMGGHGLIDRGGWIRPTYWVYEMLAGFSGEALAVETVGAPLSAFAARDDRSLRVLLVNRSTEPVTVALELATDPADGVLEVASLDEATFDELLSTRVATQPADDPIAVPARAVVVVRSDR